MADRNQQNRPTLDWMQGPNEFPILHIPMQDALKIDVRDSNGEYGKSSVTPLDSSSGFGNPCLVVVAFQANEGCCLAVLNLAVGESLSGSENKKENKGENELLGPARGLER